MDDGVSEDEGGVGWAGCSGTGSSRSSRALEVRERRKLRHAAGELVGRSLRGIIEVDEVERGGRDAIKRPEDRVIKRAAISVT